MDETDAGTLRYWLRRYGSLVSSLLRLMLVSERLISGDLTGATSSIRVDALYFLELVFERMEEGQTIDHADTRYSRQGDKLVACYQGGPVHVLYSKGCHHVAEIDFDALRRFLMSVDFIARSVLRAFDLEPAVVGS